MKLFKERLADEIVDRTILLNAAVRAANGEREQAIKVSIADISLNGCEVILKAEFPRGASRFFKVKLSEVMQ